MRAERRTNGGKVSNMTIMHLTNSSSLRARATTLAIDFLYMELQYSGIAV